MALSSIFLKFSVNAIEVGGKSAATSHKGLLRASPNTFSIKSECARTSAPLLANSSAASKHAPVDSFPAKPPQTIVNAVSPTPFSRSTYYRKWCIMYNIYWHRYFIIPDLRPPPQLTWTPLALSIRDKHSKNFFSPEELTHLVASTWRHVFPSELTAFTSAPWVSSKSKMAQFPFLEATWIGATRVKEYIRLASAPESNNI